MVCYFFLLPVCHRSGLHKDSSEVLHALLPNSPPHLVEFAALTLVFNYISMKLVKQHTQKNVVVAEGRENHRTWFWWYWSFLFSINILSPLLYLTQLILPLWKETSCVGNVALFLSPSKALAVSFPSLHTFILMQQLLFILRSVGSTWQWSPNTFLINS